MESGARNTTKKPKMKNIFKRKMVNIEKLIKIKVEPKNACHKCGLDFGSRTGPTRNEDWIQCKPYCFGFHESCAEECGILDDDSVTCQCCVYVLLGS